MAQKRVVITGVSAIASDSRNKEELWKNLNSKHFHVVPIQDSFEKNYKFKSRFYVPFPSIKIDEYGFSPKNNILMEDNARIAIVCAKMALEDAGIKLEKNPNNTFRTEGCEEAGIIIGTALCAIGVCMNSFMQHATSHLKHPELSGYRYNKMVIPIAMNNSPAAWISIMLGLKGESYTVSTACSSANYAIGQACRQITSGNSKVMLAGGVEFLKDDFNAIMRGFDTIGALTTHAEGHPQPFSKKRDGFLYSEGAGAILVLEELEHALERGAEIYAEIADFGFNSDSYNIVQMDESGAQIRALMEKLIKDQKIDYINSHGTGTVMNETVEGKMIKDLFGKKDNQPYINSTKSILGHSLGASAAIEAAVTLMSMKHQRIHPNLSEDNMDDLNVVTESTPCEINTAISSSYSFGGHNSAILFKRYSK